MLGILHRENVQEVFCELLERNGEVTSKEVKDELRNRGFWAIQAQVSWCVKSHYKDWGAILHYNGKYNVYLPEDAEEEDDMPVMNNIASVSIDIDEEDEDDATPCQKKKCRITTTQRISDNEMHINCLLYTSDAADEL